MIDIQKHLEFFNPIEMKDPVHVIGVGAIGSHVVEQLTRLGIENIHMYDFDTVDMHNIANQKYTFAQIGMPKVVCMEEYLHLINPDAKIELHKRGWTDERLSGYIFLCVDNIDLRREIAEQHVFVKEVKAMFDFRMGLEDAQAYAADWSKPESIKAFLSSMAFTHEEAKDATPVSACGTTLSVIPTVAMIVSLGIANFIKFCKTGQIKQNILTDTFAQEVLAF